MKPDFTFSLLLSLLVVANIPAQAFAVNESDSLALVDLYNSTNGNEWGNHDNWLTKAPVYSWYGIEVSKGRVTGISLGVNNLQGTLPACIGNLTSLEHLYLYSNGLTGAIPSSIGNLVDLQDCLLNDNGLSGAIPSFIGRLIHLQQLDLARNALSHPIPFSIGGLINAEYINLSGNQLSGNIPHSVGMLTGVKIFELAGNRLSGLLPSSMGNMHSLQYLYLQDNQLSGSIPSSVGNLHNLQYLYLDNNRLSGDIPDALSHLANLQLLSLTNNQFSGAIPSSLGNLANLAYLYLSYNNLSGTVPFSLIKLANLQYLYLDHNHLSQGKNSNPFVPLNISLHGDIGYNDFTFDGLDFLAAHYPFISYSPQALLSVHRYNSALSSYAGGTLNKSDFVWFREEDMSRTVVHGDSTFQPLSAGHYFAWVRNVAAPQLVLYTDTFEYMMPAEKMITALPSVISHGLQIYPNPAKDIVHIRLEGVATLVLMDANGKALLSKTVSGSDVMDVSRLASGAYYLQNKTTGESLRMMLVK